MNQQFAAESIPVIMTDQEVTQAVGVEQPADALPPSSLIKSLCASLKELRKGRSIALPIKKIRNISVYVSIHKSSRTEYKFAIQPNDFSVDEDQIFQTVNKTRPKVLIEDEDNFIEHVVRNSLLSLKKLKFDNLMGAFYIEEPSQERQKMFDLEAEFCQAFKDDEHMEMDSKECCVCFTMTQSRTNCDHSVCLECISKLKPVEIADGAKHIGCPMCRQRITSLL
jgi:hypothetical protein